MQRLSESEQYQMLILQPAGLTQVCRQSQPIELLCKCRLHTFTTYYSKSQTLTNGESKEKNVVGREGSPETFAASNGNDES